MPGLVVDRTSGIRPWDGLIRDSDAICFSYPLYQRGMTLTQRGYGTGYGSNRAAEQLDHLRGQRVNTITLVPYAATRAPRETAIAIFEIRETIGSSGLCNRRAEPDCTACSSLTFRQVMNLSATSPSTTQRDSVRGSRITGVGGSTMPGSRSCTARTVWWWERSSPGSPAGKPNGGLSYETFGACTQAH